MPRSAKASNRAADASGDGGIGTPKGITSEIVDDSRNPWSTSQSCISSAVSLGAGGHLNGVDVTPMTTRPPPNPAIVSRTANAPATV